MRTDTCAGFERTEVYLPRQPAEMNTCLRDGYHRRPAQEWHPISEEEEGLSSSWSCIGLDTATAKREAVSL